MKFAVTVAEQIPGKCVLIAGPDIAVDVQEKSLREMADFNGSGNTRVMILYSNGSKKKCSLNLDLQKSGKKAKTKD